MKKISSALTILESPDELAAARDRVAREREIRRQDEGVLDRIVTPRAASQALRSEPQVTVCMACETPEVIVHEEWCPNITKTYRGKA